MWRELSAEAMRPGAKPESVRLAVIAGLTRATGARYGDLLRVRAEDLDLGPEAARRRARRRGEGRVLLRHGKHRTVRRAPAAARGRCCCCGTGWWCARSSRQSWRARCRGRCCSRCTTRTTTARRSRAGCRSRGRGWCCRGGGSCTGRTRATGRCVRRCPRGSSRCVARGWTHDPDELTRRVAGYSLLFSHVPDQGEHTSTQRGPVPRRGDAQQWGRRGEDGSSCEAVAVVEECGPRVLLRRRIPRCTPGTPRSASAAAGCR